MENVNSDVAQQFFGTVEQVVVKPTSPTIYAKDNVKIELKIEQPKLD
jgi:hypothetical protein